MSLKVAGDEVASQSFTSNDDVYLQWLFKFNGTWKLRERTNFEQVKIIFIIIIFKLDFIILIDVSILVSSLQ